jgi:hypothetical protein
MPVTDRLQAAGALLFMALSKGLQQKFRSGSIPLGILLLIKQLEKDKYEEQQGVITIACVYDTFSGPKAANRAIVVKQQQKYQYKPEQRAIISSAAVLDI